MKLSTAFALALLLLAPGVASADPIGVTLDDPAECLPNSACPPDISGAWATYDPVVGSLQVAVTFYEASTAPDPSPLPYEFKFVLANDQTAGHCGNIALGNIASGLGAGDVILRGVGTTPADFLIGGLSGVLAVPPATSSVPRTIAYSVTNPALVGRSFQCFEVSANVFVTGEPPVDQTQFVWFPGKDPAATAPAPITPPPVPPVTFPITPAAPVVAEAPRNLIAPVVSGTLRVGSLVRCGKGLWDVHVSVVTFRWFRGASLIGHASQSSYRVKKRDVGRALRCAVTVSVVDGSSASKRSAARKVRRRAV